jgi:hypothetical protein
MIHPPGRNGWKLACIAVAVLILCPAMLRADGGTLRFSRRCGDYRITLFTAPPTLTAGPVDFSVMVQTMDSESPLLDLPVTVSVYPEAHPQRRLSGTATREAATNKLFQAIQLDLPESGRWRVEVTVDSPQGIRQAQGELEISPAPASGFARAGWIGWPAVAVVIFVIHRWLVYRQRRGQPATRPPNG